ncbi:MAG: hypothetical protein ACJ74O_00830 [Frankiaceae bacterium]
MTASSARPTLPPLPAGLPATRESLHRLAEHVLSPARYAVTGRIGLRPHPGGLRTPPFGTDERVVAVEGDERVVTSATGELHRGRVATLRAAGEVVGIAPGAPAAVYRPVTPCDLDAPLTLDRQAMRALADWYALGAEALERLAELLAGEQPSEAQLWPEHLDLAITAGSVNYGFSPGDEHVADPYAYVGPHAGAPAGGDPYWNAPFGALRTVSELATAAAALAFLLEGHAKAAAAAT